MATRVTSRRCLTRREAIGQLASLAALTLAACTPLRIVLRLYPDDFDRDPGLRDQVLRAFADTVVPGAAADGHDLCRAYGNPVYPLAKYRSFLASDLCQRSSARFGEPRFDQLDQASRTALVAEALAAGGVTQQLYTGAVFLTQVAYYGGITHADGACPAIGFEGAYRFRGLEATTYPNPGRFLPEALTADGNPV